MTVIAGAKNLGKTSGLHYEGLTLRDGLATALDKDVFKVVVERNSKILKLH